jgi:hypothetical protein
MKNRELLFHEGVKIDIFVMVSSMMDISIAMLKDIS